MSFATHARGSSRDDRSGSDRLAELSHRHPSVVRFARAGWMAKGVVYVLLGVLAVSLATQEATGEGGSGEEVSQTGAIQELAEAPLGTLALWFVAGGLGLYVVWRLASIALPAESSLKTWATRAGYLVSALVYLALAATAVNIASSGGSGGGGGGESRVDRLSRDLMDMTGGRWLVGLVGVGIIAIGVVFAVRGLSASFEDDLDPGGVGPADHDTIVALGRVGWVARGVMMGIVGWFFVQAAISYSPDEAQGLDGALRDATGSTIGTWLVGAVAFGLIVYGVYCVISAPRTRLRGAD